MKLFVASDIHGSAYYCNLMLEAYKKEKADRILLLGDVLYHGPRNDLPKEYAPKKVIEMLNEISNSIYCIRGNCDTEVDQMVLKFPVLSDYCFFESGDKFIYATHGHNYNTANLPPMHKGDILLHGHTHIPACEKCGDIIYCNPGSVSIPKEDSPHSYMIIENGHIEWKNLVDGETYKTL